MPPAPAPFTPCPAHSLAGDRGSPDGPRLRVGRPSWGQSPLLADPGAEAPGGELGGTAQTPARCQVLGRTRPHPGPACLLGRPRRLRPPAAAPARLVHAHLQVCDGLQPPPVCGKRRCAPRSRDLPASAGRTPSRGSLGRKTVAAPPRTAVPPGHSGESRVMEDAGGPTPSPCGLGEEHVVFDGACVGRTAEPSAGHTASLSKFDFKKSGHPTVTTQGLLHVSF